MALEDDIRILSGVSLFEGLTADQLRVLAFGVEPLRLAARQALYREGEPADCAYVVVAGAVRLSRGREGESVAMGLARPGALLGELALIANTNRLTDAAAVADTIVLVVPRKLFRRILEEYPDVAAALHARIAEELHELVRRIDKLAPRFEP